MEQVRHAFAGAEVLAAAAADAPPSPGVYLFIGEEGDVLYVGKAARLRTRLRQHARTGPSTSHLHRRYDLVRRVVWEATRDEEAAAWREADLIFALRPAFNADPGLRSRDPLKPAADPPFLVVSSGDDGTLRFVLGPDSRANGRDHVYGCFPHLGKGVSSRLGIACSDGYTALLRLLWAAAGEGTHMPAVVTRSAPEVFVVKVDEEVRADLHRLLLGTSMRAVGALLAAASGRPPFMQPALVRDAALARGFFASGPELLRTRRLTGGIKATTVDADTYRSLVVREVAHLLETSA